MDLPCPKCGEPWDNDEIHYQVDIINDDPAKPNTTYKKVAEQFRIKGCSVLEGKCSKTDSDRGYYASAVYDLLGDDMDGAASLIEDFEMGY